MLARLLVVDDDEELLTTMAGLLTDLGHGCRASATAEGALALLEEAPADVMLVDIRMPGIDGFGLLRQARERWPELDVVMMTAYDMEFSYVDVIAAGAADFLVKPFRSDELQAKIQRILRERQLRAELLARSLHDSLTGLYNRRCLDQRLEEEVGRAGRQRHHLAVIILDIDRFKDYNDRYGHLDGDVVLTALGKILTASIRRNVDSAYRFGGDEFAMLVVEADATQALRAAERVRRAFADLSPGGCTVSLGIACLNGSEDTQDLLRRADMALLQAKREGGNRVTSLAVG